MPISKKDRIQREHRKADAAGTRAPVKPNGNPVKAPKPKVICSFCRKEMDAKNQAILVQHAGTHADEWTREKCFPEIEWKDASAAPAPAPAAKPTVKAAGKTADAAPVVKTNEAAKDAPAAGS